MGWVIRRRPRSGALASMVDRALFAVPFILLAAVGLLRLMLGRGHELLALLAIAPACAVAVGGPVYTLSVGVAAVAAGALLAYQVGTTRTDRSRAVLFLAIMGVTTAGALASRLRCRRESELAEVRTVADVTQRVLLRPVPDRIGSVRLAARYLSASNWARVGGDLYAAVPTAKGVRLIVGDAEGKGLSAVEEAATAMGAFRAAADQAGTLGEVAAYLDVTLDHELGDEQFITAVLAEISPDGSEMEMINCGHPHPLQLSSHGPQVLEPAQCSPPLGLGLHKVTDRIPYTVPLRPGEPVLLYTDGLCEARNRAGEFFPLTDCASLQTPADPSVLLDRLSAEVAGYVRHQPDDDMALLLVERTAP
jgi:serine phosphatase RsbU (regulator of sigma subunit)